jgi:hypothetical protein
MGHERCHQCGADLTDERKVKCEYCGWVNWDKIKGALLGYAFVAAGSYLLKKGFPKLDEKKPWSRRILDWFAGS